MFTKEGQFKLVVGQVVFSEPRFPEGKGPTDFDINIEVTNADNEAEHDWIRLEWSESYGRGGFATMRQREITARTLRNAGFEDSDLSTLPDFLQGKLVSGYVKASKPNADGKVYYNVYLGGGGGNAPSADAKLSPEELRRRLTANPASGPAKAAPAGVNPFKKAAAKPAAAPVQDDSETNPF